MDSLLLFKVFIFHLFVFDLGNKLGIIEAIENFWSDNVDVHVFRLMLNNQLNDKFRNLHEQLKVAAADLVQALLKRQHYLKPDSFVQAEVGKKIRGSLEV